MKKFLKFVFLLSLLFMLSGCGLNYETIEKDGKTLYVIDGKKYEESEKKTNLIKIDVEGKGIIIAELFPEVAPMTVKNFKKLVSEKFYDGLIFHRVINGFMIQTGDPLGNGTGGSDETIKGEFELNGVKNDISHVRGVLSMARQGANPDTEQTMNSASSQFFIVQTDYPSLDGMYAAFGNVISGMDVVDKIANVTTDENDKPYSNQIMKSIRFVKLIEE